MSRLVPYLLITALCLVAALAIVTASDGKKPVIRIGKAATIDGRCYDAYKAVRWYRARYDQHRRTLGWSLAPPVEQAMACRRLRERAAYWIGAARANRLHVAKFKTIRDRPSWQAAIQEVQRGFPDTAGWLDSCSDAEGMSASLDRVWYTFGYGRYYPGFEHTYTVGGPMQYKWPTFKGHYRHGLESLRERGFRVKLPPARDVAAYLSFTAHAVAGGWARWSGNDDEHWSASWGNGC